MKTGEVLDEEIGARITAMEETGNIEPSDMLRTALEDIVGLTAEEHVAYDGPDFARQWNAIRTAARRRLKTL